MPYLLGIDIGSGTTKAAVARPAAARDARGPLWEPVSLGVRSRTVPSALATTPEGAVAPAEAHRDTSAAVSGYLARVGDSLPMLVGQAYYPAHGLVAAMARWVVNQAWELLDEPPERVALACPTGWGPGRLRLVHAALTEADLAGTLLVTRARAVVESFQVAGRVAPSGGMLLVYRLGEAGVEVSVVLPHGPGRLELLGSAELDEISGYELDDVTPEHMRAVLRSTVDLAEHTVRGCGGVPAELAAVLIAGGSAPVLPVVTELLGAAFAVPVLVDHDPQLTVAGGAALAGRPQSRTVPPPSPQEPPAAAAPAVVGATPSWPEQAGGVRVLPERPPRPAVRVGPVRAEAS
ncbi:hypothetical protein [Actinoplanes sp. NPDC049265]|uniref:hypothetical protein n=1 Tax=Actinoplanes sp. NPDC049265 TaxID=3363902 RepID=UPI003716E1B7